MTPDKILEAAAALRRQLEPHLPGGHIPYRCDPALQGPRTPADIASHSLWMLEQVPAFVAEGRAAKAMRWVCFIQGALWTAGLTTIDAMKEMNT